MRSFFATIVLTAQLTSIFGQEDSGNRDLLPFVPDQISNVQVFRPAKITSSTDFKELKKIGSEEFAKVVSRLENRYFKFGLSKLEEVDSLIFVDWIRKDPKRQSYSHHDVMILKTIRSNSDGFDMATHAVDTEIEFKGKTILKMKMSLEGKYKFACIADDQTIIWSKKFESMKHAIQGNRKSRSKEKWYKAWSKHNEEHFSFAMNISDHDFRPMQLPVPLKNAKGLEFATGGCNFGKTSTLGALVKCKDEQRASQLAGLTQKLLEELKQKTVKDIQRGSSDQKIDKTYLNFFNVTEIKQKQDIVHLKSSFRVDLKNLVQPIQEIHEADMRTTTMNRLRQNTLAVHNFESAFGHFPSPVMVHASGKKYSWRIAILPFVGRSDIYKKYDFTQDWDSPHNLEVTSEMPDYFRSEGDDPDSTNASFFMLTGPGGLPHGTPFEIRDFTDGTSNTILAVEAKRDVHWSKPEDIYIDPNEPLPDFGGFHKGGFNATMADGSVRFISEKVAADVLRQLFTPAGGEIVDRNLLNPPDDNE